jgi:hypothetical protein
MVYADMVRQYFLDKDKIRPENLIEIRFEDFSKDMVNGLERIFDQFDISGFDVARRNFDHYLDELSDIRQNRYEITPETINWVNQYAGDIVDRLNYPRRD